MKYAINTYRCKEEINIVNADNNMGKSKFYNAILWILKDEVYDSDKKYQLNKTPCSNP
jgi:DNA sulfur modification protein DndD